MMRTMMKKVVGWDGEFDTGEDDERDDDDVDEDDKNGDEQDEDTRGSFASHGTSTPERGVKPRLS